MPVILYHNNSFIESKLRVFEYIANKELGSGDYEITEKEGLFIINKVGSKFRFKVTYNELISYELTLVPIANAT